MANCNGGIANLTPYEGYRCFVEADVWRQIGVNSNRMWADFTSTTIGEWVAIIFGFGSLFAWVAMAFFPLAFAHRLLMRLTKVRLARSAGHQEIFRQRAWGIYLVVCGVGWMVVSGQSNERFFAGVGIIQFMIGFFIIVLGPSWWAPLSPRQAFTKSSGP